MTLDLSQLAGPPAVRDAHSAPFYDAAARGELLTRHCTACDRALAPDARSCSECSGLDLAWRTASGAARLVSFAIVHHTSLSVFARQTPFSLGLVELSEGPWLYARIVHAGAELAAGMALRAAFVQPPEGESYPVFVTE